ncbi:ImmA/IrrE family metallo-endopeptidase [Segetibacter sp. 3557_3]|uniref:helix-turn-helix domain-containing protein n=1 Tax=Segetibacter sp. 3557_3 TaxID=2547429 RepID=UPI00105920BE|nr:XRE family transcriptional regulator [Segetibacter sp. 3557_3]TDH18247.1 ImmA/IrrE family metallo-endopeptidase [Segetibacter sp. 3557_3]
MGQSDINIFGTRLKLARKLAAMSLQDLSDALSNKVTKQALSKYEQGEMNPSSQVLLAISKALQLKPDYFLKKKSLALGQILFRKRAALSKKDEDSIVEKVRDYVERYIELEEILNVQSGFINPLRDFVIEQKSDVEKAADKLRIDWNLGDKPIANMVEMLELKGIKVIVVDDVDALDGLAVFTSTGIPILVVNRKNKSIERIRFTIVHELAHLLLNLAVVEGSHKLQEEWCHFFSSCFLMPSHMLRKMIGGEKRTYIYINELIKIKEYYGISIRAIVHRLRELVIITDNYYQRWLVYMSKQYGQKGEPGEYKGEEASKGFDLLIARGLSEGILSLSKAASLCNTDINILRKEYVSIH